MIRHHLSKVFNLFIILALFATPLTATAATGDFQFAKRLGGTGSDTGYEVATDSSGNIIVAGHVTGDADLNGDGDYTDDGESSTGYGSTDVVFSVFNSDGVFKFAKRLGGTGTDRGRGVATDSLGNIIVSGYISGNADLNGDGDSTDGGAESGTGFGGYDIFFSVFNSDGEFQFAKRIGSTGSDTGLALAVDTSGNIIVGGYLAGNADLNGDGDNTDGGAEDSTGYGGYDVVFSVFNSSGVFQFAKRLGGTSSDIPYALTTDTSGNIIVAGLVNGNADLNGDGDSTDGGAESGTGYGNNDVFFSVFNSSGVFQFAKRLGGTSSDQAQAVTTDPDGNIIVTGYVQGSADLNGDGDRTDGGAESSTGYGTLDVFLSVFNSDGEFQFAKRLGGTSADYGEGLATDTYGNIIVTGYVKADRAADFNGDGDKTDEYEGSWYGNYDAFFSVFNSDGEFQFAKRLGGANRDSGFGVAVGPSGNIIIVGSINDDADLNGDTDTTDTYETAGAASYDIFFSVFSGYAPVVVVVESPSSPPPGGGTITGLIGTVGPWKGMPGYVEPRYQIVYPDGTVVYMDEPKPLPPQVAAVIQAVTNNPTTQADYFPINLKRPTEGPEVLKLQKFLNTHGAILAEEGAGSPGNETIYFSRLTHNAIIKYQEMHQEEILTTVGLTKGSGYFGPSTRAYANKVMRGEL